MSKFGTFGDYPKESLSSAQAALLTAWSSLERYQDDLVLVGGLAVHYLTKPSVAGLPGAVTMDVDFGISLAASAGQYGTIKTDLAGLGFKTEGARLVRKFGNLNLYLDFLTEDPPSMTGARMVDDVVASVIPGVNRALACRRVVPVKGKDLYGKEQELKVAVADIGPLLVLKLNAFGGPTGRRLPKDAYDVLLVTTGFVDGPESAIAGFRKEAGTGNTGYVFALKSLEDDFVDPRQDGPIRASEFYPGNPDQSDRIRQDVATIGRFLLGR
jgi:hypothetical protein